MGDRHRIVLVGGIPVDTFVALSRLLPPGSVVVADHQEGPDRIVIEWSTSPRGGPLDLPGHLERIADAIDLVWEQDKPDVLGPADASLVRVAATLVESYRPSERRGVRAR